MTSTRKIGFACKWLDEPRQVDGFKPKDPAKAYNTGSTTVRWLNEHTNQAEDKLWSLVQANIASVYKLLEKVGELDINQRMVRLGSDILPVYTEPTWGYFYKRQDVRDYCSREFGKVGEFARANNIRLSFHPGQFCVLASDDADIVRRSVEEFEYHTDMARWMGYGSAWHDHGFKINVHIAGRQGPAGIVAALKLLSTEARNLITIENDENKWGLAEILELERHCALVLDIHHHWVNSGEYITADDDRTKRVRDSWRGVRPTMHYSLPRDEYVQQHLDSTGLPMFDSALAHGVSRTKLRAHSDFYWCNTANQWALTFTPHFDIMCEAKGKNLASRALYETAQSAGML